MDEQELGQLEAALRALLAESGLGWIAADVDEALGGAPSCAATCRIRVERLLTSAEFVLTEASVIEKNICELLAAPSRADGVLPPLHRDDDRLERTFDAIARVRTQVAGAGR